MMDTFLPILMAAVTLGAIVAGVRVGIVLAGSAAIFILVSDLPLAFFNLIISRIYANVLSNWLLVAVPMFIFMGLILEKSGVAERALKGAQERSDTSNPAKYSIFYLPCSQSSCDSSGSSTSEQRLPNYACLEPDLPMLRIP